MQNIETFKNISAAAAAMKATLFHTAAIR